MTIEASRTTDPAVKEAQQKQIDFRRRTPPRVPSVLVNPSVLSGAYPLLQSDWVMVK